MYESGIKTLVFGNILVVDSEKGFKDIALFLVAVATTNLFFRNNVSMTSYVSFTGEQDFFFRQ